MSEWSVLIKAARGAAQGMVARADLERLVELLPGTDKGFTGGDGPDLTVSFWLESQRVAAPLGRYQFAMIGCRWRPEGRLYGPILRMLAGESVRHRRR